MQDNKKLLNSAIKKILKLIEDYSDFVGGLYITDVLYKHETNLNNLLKQLSLKSYNLEEKTLDLLIEKTLPEIVEIINKKIEARNNIPTEIELQNRVIERAEKKGGFIEFILNDNQSLKVAKIPFLLWCIGDTPYEHGKENGDLLYDITENLEKLWGETISYSGEKLPNDNIYHNEWIRSAKISPKDYYDLVEKVENKKWIHNFTFHYQMIYLHYLLDKNEPLSFYDKIDESIESFKYIYKRNNKPNEIQELIAIPYHINPDTKFPIYIKPLYQNEMGKEDIKKLGQNYFCVIVKNSDESVNEIALALSDSINSVIFTNNPSKTAHLINVAEDINLNIFYLPNEIKLKDTCIYELNKNGHIEEIANGGYSNGYIPLQDCKISKKSLKLSNLALLKESGFNVPNGFFVIGNTCANITTKTKQMIARSCGLGEGGKKARFSGIFKSKKLDINSIDNNQTTIKDVIESFNSSVARKYATKMKVDLPKCGILYQEYIEAEFSYVVKAKNDIIYIEKTSGEASKLVNGEIIPTVYEYNINDKVDNEWLDIIAMVKDIQKVLNDTNLELEIIEKNNIYYIVQAI